MYTSIRTYRAMSRWHGFSRNMGFVLSLIAPLVGALTGTYQRLRYCLPRTRRISRPALLPQLHHKPKNPRDHLSLPHPLNHQFTPNSSLSFAKFSSVSVALSLRRERTSLAPLAQTVPSPFPLFLPRSTSQGLQARGVSRPIDLGGSEGGRGGSPALCASQGSKKPTRVGVGLDSLGSIRQVIDDDDSSTRSVGRSVGRSHRRRALLPRSGGMSEVSCLRLV